MKIFSVEVLKYSIHHKSLNFSEKFKKTLIIYKIW